MNKFDILYQDLHRTEEIESGGGRACLEHLLTHYYMGDYDDYYGTPDRRVLGIVIVDAYKAFLHNCGRISKEQVHNLGSLYRLLERHGLKVCVDHLLVANDHPELREIFRGTSWDKGFWRLGLRLLADARSHEPINFSPPGKRVRCTAVPMRHVSRLLEIYLENYPADALWKGA